jgi:hypothetical protein
MRYAKKDQLERLESFELEALSDEILLCLERAYAACALFDERASGPSQFHSCILGSDLEIALYRAEAIQDNLPDTREEVARYRHQITPGVVLGNRSGSATGQTQKTRV